MSNRNNQDSASASRQGNSKPRNTDNENTQYFSPGSYYEDTAGFSTPNSGSSYGSGDYRNAPPISQTPGRMEYYGSGQQNSSESRNMPRNGGYSQQAQRSEGGRYVQRQPQPRQPRPASQGDGNNAQRPVRPQRPPQQRPPQNRNGQRPMPQSGSQPARRRPSNEPASRSSSAQPRKRPQNPVPPQKQQAPKKKKRRKNIFVRLFTGLLAAAVVIFAVYSIISVSLIKKLNQVESEPRNHAAGAMHESYVTNVLCIGTDGRTLNERGRSDTMILLSINSKTNEIYLTSFMRDSYVEIPGHGNNKLNAAYSFGGADLLMDTIELNFNVRIDNYIAVNFNSFASIIDSVGGIEMEVSDAEAREINTILMAEVNELMGDAVDSDLLGQGGKILLNGKQALSYARIRYIGNADFERTERQRNVITKVAEKLKSFKPSYFTDIAKNAVPQITTNMSSAELYFLSLRLPFVIGYDFQQLRVPAEGTYGSISADGVGSALSVDFAQNINLIRENVFAEN